MRAALCVVALAACLTKPSPPAAVEVDAAADAVRSTCPADRAPVFANTRVVTTSQCSSYVPSEDGQLAVAWCSVISEGPPAGPYTPISFSPAGTYTMPQLAPEGDRMIVRLDTTPTRFQVFRRASPNVWMLTETLPGMYGGTDHFSPPSRMTAGSRLVVWMTSDLVELDGTSGWSLVHAYRSADFGVQNAVWPTLSPDGLELVFDGNLPGDLTRRAFYSSRPSIDALFGPAHEITGLPQTYTMYLPSDCSRLVYSGATLGPVYSFEP